MALQVTHPASDRPRGRRPKVCFHLVHEHRHWVLRAHEERVANIHSRHIASHSSTSVLYTAHDYSEMDVGFKIFKPEELLPRAGDHDVMLLTLVLFAQRRDEDHILFPGHNHAENLVLKLKRGYLRLFEWLSFHPLLVVPAHVLKRLKVH